MLDAMEKNLDDSDSDSDSEDEDGFHEVIYEHITI